MRICLKCSAYYADDSLGFCLVDGTPLTGVEPGCEIWSDGARVLEEKENALRKTKRTRKWRLVAMTVLTMLIATMVTSTSVTVVRTSVEPVPSPSPSPSPSPLPSESPTPPGSPTPTPTSTPSPTPTPTPTQTLVYKISGRVMQAGKPFSGVSMTLGGTKTASQMTDANGYYMYSGLSSGGTYNIAPARAKTTFTPANRSFNNLRKDGSADFSGVADVELFKISGRVTEAGRPLSGVKLTLGGTKTFSQTTGADGFFTFSQLPSGGTYNITPARAKTEFRPANRTFNNLTADGSADFSGLSQAEFIRISGRVTEAGRPVSGVNLMLAGTKTASQTTDANGYYTFNRLPSGGFYNVTPARAKTRFTPAHRPFDNLKQDASADFSTLIQHDPPPPPNLTPACGEAEKRREHNAIVDRFSAEWRRRFESEGPKIRDQYARKGMEAQATLGEPTYRSVVFPDCSGALVTVRYVWQVKLIHGVFSEKVDVPKQKRFSCSRFGATWQCYLLPF